jgi:hypothetical protein
MDTPLVIRMMLACYYSADPASECGATWDSTEGQSARGYLFNNRLIDETSKATERGEAWVNMVCATPLPKQVWADPRKPLLPEEPTR